MAPSDSPDFFGLELLMNGKKRNGGSDNVSVISGSGGGNQDEDIRSVYSVASSRHSAKMPNINHYASEESSVVDIKVNEIDGSESEVSYRSRSSGMAKQQKTFKPAATSFASASASESQYSEEEDKSDLESLGSMLAKGTRGSNRMSEIDVLNAKRELLYQFDRMEKKGMKLPKKFTMASSLEEMKMEYERLKKDRDVDNAVKFQRRVLMMFTSGVEYATSKYSKLNIKLDGWSESVHENIDDYDDVFEELYDKYKGKAKMAPELKLLMTLGGSAFMFHMTNNLFKNSMPGLDQVLKQNPELMKQFAAATANTMKQEQPQGSLFSGIAGMFSNMFGSGQTQSAPMPSYNPSQETEQPKFNMRGPSNVDDIIRDFEKNDNDRIEVMSTVTSSEFTELQDDMSINNLIYNGKKKKGGKKITLDL